jgi:hypothetical protein
MREHWQYLKYMTRHKWYVFQECRKLHITWRGICHDLSKFRPDEWFPYLRYFYGKWPKQVELSVYEKTYFRPRTQEDVDDEFDLAWLKHQKRNEHHWQFWLLWEDDGIHKVLPMTYEARCEMLADWRGAGKAITGQDNTAAWYTSHKDMMQLHSLTRVWIERKLGLIG